MTDKLTKNMRDAIKKYENKTPEQKAKEKKELKKRQDKMKSTPKEKKLVKQLNKAVKKKPIIKPKEGRLFPNVKGSGGAFKLDVLGTSGKMSPVTKKFFTGGSVHPSFGTDFDDR
tara:strand:- start:1614 stop:1958 length:345 start_codon:yes stop_codon:yes gene_type:complete